MTLVGAVRTVSLALAVILMGMAVAAAVVPLPIPAAGGTCGPGAGSEPAVAALFDPISIGAGTEPPAGSVDRSQWQAFVSECQSATDRRMVVSGSILAAGLLVLAGSPWVARRVAGELAGGPDAPGAPPAPPSAAPGWYADPADPRALRWWDGWQWGPQAMPSSPG